MRIRDDDVRRTGGFGGGDCSERFARHELAESAILETRRPELIASHGAGNALHIDGDQYLLRSRLTRRRRREHGHHEHNGSDENDDRNAAHESPSMK